MKRKANFTVLTESEAQKIQGGCGFAWIWSFFCWWSSNCGGGNGGNNGGCGNNNPPTNPGGNP